MAALISAILIFATLGQPPAGDLAARNGNIAEIPLPPMEDDAARAVWDLVQKQLTAGFRDHALWDTMSPEEIAEQIVEWIGSKEAKTSAELRRTMYGAVAKEPLSSSMEGASLLLQGVSDPDPSVRMICATALVRSPSSLKDAVDESLVSFLQDNQLSANDRAIVLENLATFTSYTPPDKHFVPGDKLHNYLKALIQGSVDEYSAQWGTMLLTRRSGAYPVVAQALMKAQASETRIGILGGVRLSGKSLFTGAHSDHEELLRASVLKQLQHPDVKVRKMATLASYATLGPTAYEASEAQLRLNLRVRDAFLEMKSEEKDPEMLAMLETYLLPSFAPNGRLKSDKELRQEMKNRTKTRE